MKRILLFCVAAISILIVAGPQANAGEWRFPVGLSYVSGMGELTDQVKDNLETQYYDVDTTESAPVGLSFQP